MRGYRVDGCLACATVRDAESPSSSLDFGITATVDVGADGHAHVVEMGKVSKLADLPAVVPVADQVACRLRERIESWQFVPATANGMAVASRTHLGVSMRARDDGHGGMAVRIESAVTGGSVRHRNMAGVAQVIQTHPEELLVAADLGYAEDGRVVDVVLTDARRFAGIAFTGRVDRNIQKGMVHALNRWTFEPELVDGRPVSGHGRLPMRFCVSPACDNAPADHGLASNATEFASTDPAVTLRSAVAGTAL